MSRCEVQGLVQQLRHDRLSCLKLGAYKGERLFNVRDLGEHALLRRIETFTAAFRRSLHGFGFEVFQVVLGAADHIDVVRRSARAQLIFDR